MAEGEASEMNKGTWPTYGDQAPSYCESWRRRNRYYHNDLEKFHTFVIPGNCSVLEIGCGTGDLLNSVRPSRGLGIDINERMVERASRKFPHLEFQIGDAESLEVRERFDYVIMSNLIGSLNDVWRAFRELEKVVHPWSRVVITYYNYLWEPFLRVGERLGFKMPTPIQNWLSLRDIANFLHVNHFEVVNKGYRLLFPKYLPFISATINNVLGKLPGIRKLGVIEYVVARPLTQAKSDGYYSCSVIIPCRNEVDYISDAVKRVPEMGRFTEIIFVDGHSSDGTVEVIEETIRQHSERAIKLIHQIPRNGEKDVFGEEYHRAPNKMLTLGKGDAVRKGFEAATGDILMILDADLTVAPEDLPKFFEAMASGKGEFINGSRLVYPLQKQAMRVLNILGNKIFSLVFTWLLEQPVGDTLCGTKALFRRDYARIKANRKFFGDFDPYGDFDLLLGAAKLNLKIVEMPVRYVRRVYGDVKISRWRHGWLLLKMSCFAIKKLKFI